MQPRARRLATPLVVAVLALSAGTALAQLPIPSLGGDPPLDGPGSGAPIMSFTVVGAINLADVSAAEILGGGGAARDAGTASVGVGGSTTAYLGDPVGGAAPVTGVTREANPVWEAWIHRKDLDSVQASYELTALNGNPGRLSSADSGLSEIGVSLTPLPLQTSLSSGSWYLTQGGVRMQLDLSGASVAGDYGGTLLVILNSL